MDSRMARKLPAFQFYPGDWMKDAELRSCSTAARGVWIDMLCLMFDMPTRGVLRWESGTPWTIIDVVRSCAGSRSKNVKELIDKGCLKVASRTGTLWSKRMVVDERSRRRKARSGAIGGQAKGKQTGSKSEANTLAKVGSSSSSSSSSSDRGQQQHTPHDPSSDSVVVVSLLRNVGIAESTSIDLAGEFGLDRVREVIALAENTEATNPSGYVIHALRQGWTAPKVREAAPVVRTPQQGGPSDADKEHERDVLARTALLTDEEIKDRCAVLGGFLPDAWANGRLSRDCPGDMAAVLGE